MKGPRELASEVISFATGVGEFPLVGDYDTADETVKMFFEAAERVDGFATKLSENEDTASRVLEAMSQSIDRESALAMRYAYQNMLKTLAPNDDAVIAEDLDSGIEDMTPTEHRFEAIAGLNKFSALNPHIATVVSDIEALVLDGAEDSIRSAAAMTKVIYASKTGIGPTDNVRLAYTSLSTQDGEPYQMCPKAVQQIGYAVPMELSKCRDNCIDSRKDREGHITCAYQDWLEKVADNQESVMARLDKQRINFNEDKTLNDISRPGPSEDEESRESMREGSEVLKKQNKDYSREEILDQSLERTLEQRGLHTVEASNKDRRTLAHNTRESAMKKSFNLAEHIKGTSINEKLEEARSYFGDSLGNKAPREMNLDNDGKNKYSDPGTNMEKLVSEKHKGSPDKTMEEQMEPKRKNDVARGTTTAEDALDSKRNNDGMSYYMKTLEEHLNARRHSAE